MKTIKYSLKQKCQLVNELIGMHHGFVPYSLYSFTLPMMSDCYVLVVHYLFRLLVSSKRDWASTPGELSALNYVIRHLRYMLTNLDSDGIRKYALDNLFFHDGNAEVSSSKVG